MNKIFVCFVLLVFQLTAFAQKTEIVYFQQSYFSTLDSHSLLILVFYFAMAAFSL